MTRASEDRLRVEHLGIDPKWVNVLVNRHLVWVQQPIVQANYETSLGLRLRETYMLMAGLYLQNRDAELARYADLLFERATEYFAGQWRRQHPDENTRRGGGLWVDEARAIIGLGAALHEWDTLRSIASEIDPTTSDVSTLARHRRWIALVVYCAAERAEALPKAEALAFDDAATDLERAAARCAVFLLSKSDSFKNAFDEFVGHFRRTVFQQRDLACKVCFEGTYFYHAAVQNGMIAASPRLWPAVMQLEAG